MEQDRVVRVLDALAVAVGLPVLVGPAVLFAVQRPSEPHLPSSVQHSLSQHVSSKPQAPLAQHFSRPGIAHDRADLQHSPPLGHPQATLPDSQHTCDLGS